MIFIVLQYCIMRNLIFKVSQIKTLPGLTDFVLTMNNQVSSTQSVNKLFIAINRNSRTPVEISRQIFNYLILIL